MTPSKDLIVPKGKYWPYTLNFKVGGNPTPITGWIIHFTVKRNTEDLEGDAVISKDVTSHTDATNGITTIELLPEDTENLDDCDYYYDITIEKTAGRPQQIVKGKFTLEYTVTNRYSGWSGYSGYSGE